MNKYDNAHKKRVSMDSRYWGIIGVIVIIIIFFTCLQPKYLSVSNIFDILLDASIPVIISLGMATVIAAGGFDMSIGHICGFSATVCAIMMKNVETSIPVAIFVSILVSMGIGLVNGLIVSNLGISSFITTLGMQFVLVGIRFWITNGVTITNFSKDFISISRGNALGFSNQILYMIVAIAAFFILMSRTKFGRRLSAVGSNIDAAHYSGIHTKLYTMISFVISGLMAGIGGIILLARNAMEHVGMGDAFMMDAITIAVFSAVIFTRFNSIGIFLAALVVSMVTMGISMSGFNPSVTNVVVGFILLAVIILGKVINSDAAKARKAKRALEEWYKENGDRPEEY